MKTIILVFMLFMNCFAIASQKDGVSAKFRYQTVDIKDVVSIKTFGKFTPATENARGYYQGYVEVLVYIESNVCGASLDTIGPVFVHAGNEHIVQLVVASAADELTSTCSMESSTASVSFTLPFSARESKGKAVNETIANIPYYEPFGGIGGGTAKIILKAIDGQFEAILEK